MPFPATLLPFRNLFSVPAPTAVVSALTRCNSWGARARGGGGGSLGRNEGLLGAEGVSQAEAAELETRLRDASERVRALEWERDRLRGELGEFYAREAQLEVAVREAETEVRRREAHLENLLQKATDSLNELQAEVSQKGAELEAQRLHAQGAGAAAEKLEAQVRAVRALEDKLRREELRAANLEKILEETKEELEEAQQWREKAESDIEARGAQQIEMKEMNDQLAEHLAKCRAQTLDLKGQLREKMGALNAAQALEKKAHEREKAALKKVAQLEDKLAAGLAAAAQQPSNFLAEERAVGGEELDADAAAVVPDVTFEPEDAAPPEVEDLGKLTVAELKKRLEAAGISYPAKVKKADLLNLLVRGAAGSAGAEGVDGGEEDAGPEPEASAGAAAEEPLAGEDLGKLTVAELKKRLEAAGISYPAKVKKADLLNLLVRGAAGSAGAEGVDGGEEDAGPEPEASAGAAAEEPLAGEDLGKLTVAELKKRLEAVDISYPQKAKKAVLVELLRDGSEDRETEASDAPAKKRPTRPSSADTAKKAKRARASARKR